MQSLLISTCTGIHGKGTKLKEMVRFMCLYAL